MDASVELEAQYREVPRGMVPFPSTNASADAPKPRTAETRPKDHHSHEHNQEHGDGDNSNVTAIAAIGARFAKPDNWSPLPRHDKSQRAHAVTAHFITPRDPVIETADGDRLPAVPLTEAAKLDQLKREVDLQLHESAAQPPREPANAAAPRAVERENEAMASALRSNGAGEQETHEHQQSVEEEGQDGSDGPQSLKMPPGSSVPPSHTNPLFPPLPLYGPPSLLRTLQCHFFRFTSFFLSMGFLMAIVVGSAVSSLPLMFRHIGIRLTLQNPNKRRPFYDEEKRREAARERADAEWMRQRRRMGTDRAGEKGHEELGGENEEFTPTEGGKDPLKCDVAYYARRLGLDMEEFKVQTEDGFVIVLWHVFRSREYTPATEDERQKGKPEVFADVDNYHPETSPCSRRRKQGAPTRYPVLLMHGLLQSAGAYCSNDDDSLAFYLAKSGYDVWLGNNRCGFHPEHTLLQYGDPRLWCFNIRQMGVLDLPALISRVLRETGFPKLGLVCHSQGTTETFVALAKEQRPELGARISVFCALAPAVYAGPLISKHYFHFMQRLSPRMFRLVFGIHAFIPLMMTLHATLPGRLYGAMGYRVFIFLFQWSDARWDRGLRNRMFRFAPVYVSAESMRWWLGRDCFAKHRCILATREEGRREAAEDAAAAAAAAENEDHDSDADDDSEPLSDAPAVEDRGRRAWFDQRAPPMALWVAGSDELVDGRRLLRRFRRGREPHVRLVHAKVIEEYEHLDVLWAMDVIAQVGNELNNVLWRTAVACANCAVPRGCGGALEAG